MYLRSLTTLASAFENSPIFSSSCISERFSWICWDLFFQSYLPASLSLFREAALTVMMGESPVCILVVQDNASSWEPASLLLQKRTTCDICVGMWARLFRANVAVWQRIEYESQLAYWDCFGEWSLAVPEIFPWSGGDKVWSESHHCGHCWWLGKRCLFSPLGNM